MRSARALDLPKGFDVKLALEATTEHHGNKD
jgi:hypothetical protein